MYGSPVLTEPFKDFNLVGVQYHINENHKIWRNLKAGMTVTLKHESDNQYDRNAVSVWIKDDDLQSEESEIMIGYIPRTENAEIAAILRAGWAPLLISTIDAYNPEASYATRIHVSVCLKHYS